MGKFKKSVHNYFCFWSEAPLTAHFVTFIVILVVSLVMSLIFGHESINNNEIPRWFTLTMEISTVVLIAHLILVYKIKARFISDAKSDHNILANILLLPSGEAIVMGDTPVWGKGKVYSIERINVTYSKPCKAFFDTAILSRYRNTTVTIPVRITMELNDSFDNLELFKILHKFNHEHLSLNKYISHHFDKINKKNQNEIDELAKKYALQEISSAQLLDKVIDLLSFPDKPFSNVEDVKICLEDPSVSSCKGQTCNMHVL